MSSIQALMNPCCCATCSAVLLSDKAPLHQQSFRVATISESSSAVCGAGLMTASAYSGGPQPGYDAKHGTCRCRLSKKAKYDKRIAVTVFSFPPDKGNVGTAAYLNVFGSIHKVLKVGRMLSAPYCATSECSITVHSRA